MKRYTSNVYIRMSAFVEKREIWVTNLLRHIIRAEVEGVALRLVSLVFDMVGGVATGGSGT